LEPNGLVVLFEVSKLDGVNDARKGAVPKPILRDDNIVNTMTFGTIKTRPCAATSTVAVSSGGQAEFMDGQAVAKMFCVHTGSHSISKYCDIISIPWGRIGINEPDPWGSVSMPLNELVSVRPPGTSMLCFMATMRCMRNKEPA